MKLHKANGAAAFGAFGLLKCGVRTQDPYWAKLGSTGLRGQGPHGQEKNAKLHSACGITPYSNIIQQAVLGPFLSPEEAASAPSV